MDAAKLRKKAADRKPRVPIGKRDLKTLLEVYGTDSPRDVSRRSGLPYLLVYNVMRGRVQTVSNRHYTKLFGSSAPAQVPFKVDGTMFRAMANLWLYLNDGATRVDLYHDLMGLGPQAPVDHRIFNGKVKTVSAKLEHAMRQKFIDAGVDDALLEQWLDEYDELDPDDWIPYGQVRPMLAYIERELGVHPTAVLRQSVVRYEQGSLKHVSRATFERIQTLQRRAQKALAKTGHQQTEKIRERLMGGKRGYTLFSEIEEELLFLCRHKVRGAKHYLGRGPWSYRERKAKRIADWRAQKIRQDCEEYIRDNPELGLAELPSAHRWAHVQRLSDILVARSSQLLSGKDSLALERHILRPFRAKGDYDDAYHGFVPFDMAFNVLGMKRKAFDLMVASHCEIFRSVGKYSQRWYLPDLYLKELSGKKDFRLVSAKYEKMARDLLHGKSANTCMN